MKRNKKVLIKAALLGLVILSPTLSLSAAHAADPTLKNRIFSPKSFWYQPIPATASLHPNSSNYVQEFLRQKKDLLRYGQYQFDKLYQSGLLLQLVYPKSER